MACSCRMRTEENNVVLFGSEPPTPFRLPDFSLSISSLCVGITSLPVQADGRGGGATQDDSKYSIPYLPIPSSLSLPISPSYAFCGKAMTAVLLLLARL
jgi:hypothetical protein